MRKSGFRSIFPPIVAAGVAACTVSACTISSVSTLGGGPAAGAPTFSSSPTQGTTASGISPAGKGAAAPSAAWPEYDANAARTGAASGLPAAGKLATAWTAPLAGAVYGQPLVVGGDVIAATENDSIYALSRSTGKIVWRKHVGTPVAQKDLKGCGDIFPLGITGTPVYDAGNGLVYAVAETTGYVHLLVGLSVTTGAVKLNRVLDKPTASNQPVYNQQRPALAIDQGRVYVSFGGLAGGAGVKTCGAHQGSIVAVPLSGQGTLIRRQTPTSWGGSVWAPGGPVVGPNGNLYVGTGNGAAQTATARYDGSDSVVELTPTLQQVAYFAPSTWADDNANDFDLGSTQPAIATGGATFILGKRGVGYLLSTTKLGGIGGQLAQGNVCEAKGAAAVGGSVVYEPCTGGGIAAVSVSAAKKTFSILWRGPAGAQGSPVIGGGVVWVTRYTDHAGELYELNPKTGAVERTLLIKSGLPHFSSLSLAGGTAYVATLSGVTAVSGA